MSFEVKNPEAEKYLKEIGETIKTGLPANMGFALLMFDYGEGGAMFYLSSAQREDMLKAMREFMEKQGDHSFQETVICAAVKTATGKITRGHRHGDCYAAMQARHLSPLDAEEGFITSTNRFVGRNEAYSLQEAAGIQSVLPNGYEDRGRLFSEDLY